ncbi:MAG: hypothetical protein H0V29_01630 [Thermoleophilaceae bacterium]|nr:hypothetical protein [Thermoleophilaceae bacterium]
MGEFFIDYETGRVATLKQLAAAGLAEGEDERPERPWHRIQGPGDASTMWYAVLRKHDRGIFMGALCIRHGDRLASMNERGWEEIPVPEIGP